MSDECRAIEALRAGVPNRAAIRLMGSSETEISERFVANLRRSRPSEAGVTQVRGQIVAGGFGAGKSHLLGYLQELALQENFIVSWLAISKETPLFDPQRLFISAMRNAVVPNRNDDVMTAVLAQLRPGGERYRELDDWASQPSSGLAALFPALLHLIPHLRTDPDRLQQIGRFFAGGKLSVSTVNPWLRETGSHKLFRLKAVKAAELARQSVRFAPRLMAAAGYSGWCVLFDELELIGRYSVIQRGRSYAELARWLGFEAAAGLPGVVTAAAVTDDFSERVIGDKRDDELAPAKLMARGERDNATLAEIGMRALQGKDDTRTLRAPDLPMLQASLVKTQSLYEKAYAWTPPETPIGDRLSTKSMRQYIKSWITLWDLQRLYGTTFAIEAGTVASDYTEDTDMEQPTVPDDDGPDRGE